MRGIERVIAGILLAVAICGSAAFARGIGGEPGGDGDVQLTAAPPQHALSPHGVRVPVYSFVTDREIATAPTKKPVSTLSFVQPPSPLRAGAPAARPTHVPPRKPVPVTSRRVPRARVAPAPAAPPAPSRPAPAQPAPPQPDARILATV